MIRVRRAILFILMILYVSSVNALPVNSVDCNNGSSHQVQMVDSHCSADMEHDMGCAAGHCSLCSAVLPSLLAMSEQHQLSYQNSSVVTRWLSYSPHPEFRPPKISL